MVSGRDLRGEYNREGLSAVIVSVTSSSRHDVMKDIHKVWCVCVCLLGATLNSGWDITSYMGGHA